MTQAQTQPVSIEQWVSSVTNFSSQYDSLRYIYLFLWPCQVHVNLPYVFSEGRVVQSMVFYVCFVDHYLSF
jgi:hypothetical protein